jgi:hypothetical protein
VESLGSAIPLLEFHVIAEMKKAPGYPSFREWNEVTVRASHSFAKRRD